MTVKTSLMATAVVGAFLSVSLIGCSAPEPRLHARSLEGGGVTVTAENATGKKVSRDLEIKEGELLMVAPQLSQGQLHIVVADETGEGIVLEMDVDGNQSGIYDIGSGKFTVTIGAPTINQQTTYGTMEITVISQEDLMAGNEG